MRPKSRGNSSASAARSSAAAKKKALEAPAPAAAPPALTGIAGGAWTGAGATGRDTTDVRVAE